MNPQDLRYTKEDEWIRVEGDVATIGITDYAQEALSDIVYVELPAVGKALEAGQLFGTVESVKAVSDLFAPVAGEVIEANDALGGAPELLNQDAFGAGWLIKVHLAGTPDLSGLLDAAAYEAHCADRH